MPSSQSVPSKIGTYNVIGLLGEGEYGVVYLVQDTKGKQWAVKVAKKTGTKKEVNMAIGTVFNEQTMLNIMSSLKGIYVVDTPRQSFLSKENALIIQVMNNTLDEQDNLSCGNLEHILECIKQTQTLKVVHGDLKPDNIMFTKDGVPLLIDFGASTVLSLKFLGDSGDKDIVGTVLYASPRNHQGSGASRKNDLFSLGLIFAERTMVNGLPWKDCKSDKDILQSKLNWIGTLSSNDPFKRWFELCDFEGKDTNVPDYSSFEKLLGNIHGLICGNAKASVAKASVAKASVAKASVAKASVAKASVVVKKKPAKSSIVSVPDESQSVVIPMDIDDDDDFQINSTTNQTTIKKIKANFTEVEKIKSRIASLWEQIQSCESDCSEIDKRTRKLLKNIK